MDKRQLLARLMATFLAELDENLRSLNSELLLLEKMPSGPEREESLAKLFRAAHSLKGAARSVSQSEIEFLCHQLEEQLAALRDGRTELNPEIVSGLFAGLDKIDEAAQCLKPHTEAGTNQNQTPPVGPSQPMPPESANRVVQRAGSIITEPVIPAISSKAGLVEDDFAMVRVAAHKLDALLAWSGELLIARRRIADRTERLFSLGRTLRAYSTWQYQGNG